MYHSRAKDEILMRRKKHESPRQGRVPFASFHSIGTPHTSARTRTHHTALAIRHVAITLTQQEP